MARAAGIDGWLKRLTARRDRLARCDAESPSRTALAAYPCALSSAASTSAKPITTAHAAMRSGCGPPTRRRTARPAPVTHGPLDMRDADSAFGRISGRRPPPRSGHVFGFLALEEQPGIWPLPRARPSRIALRTNASRAAYAPFRQMSRRPSDQHVEVGAGAAHRFGAGQRVAEVAGVREQFPALLLLGVQVHATDAHARPCARC